MQLSGTYFLKKIINENHGRPQMSQVRSKMSRVRSQMNSNNVHYNSALSAQLQCLAGQCIPFKYLQGVPRNMTVGK